MDKNKIINNFSKSAESYDDHAHIQRKCAEILTGSLRTENVSKVLEVGCGTGIYTELLRERFKDAKITAVDLSKKMVESAARKLKGHNINFLVADGEDISGENKHDLITSNVSFQWFQDPACAISRFSGMLRKGGTLSFSTYGPKTFKEFEEVLNHHFGRDRRHLSSRRFPTRQDLEEMLKRYFKEYTLDEKHYLVDFASLWDFLHSIKRSGARGEGLAGDIFLGKYTILQLEKTYIEKFKRVSATHHIYYCHAKV